MSNDYYGSGNQPGAGDPSQGQGYQPQGNYPPQGYQPQGGYPAPNYQPQGSYPPPYQSAPPQDDVARYQQGYGAPPPVAPQVRKGRGPLPFIAAIVVIAALAVGGYFVWQNVASPLISGVAYDKLLPNTALGYFSYDASPSAAQQANWNKVRDAFFSQPGVKDKFDQLGQQMGMGSGMAASFVQQCNTGNSSNSGGSILTNLQGFLSGNVTFAYLQPGDAEVRQVVKDVIQSSGMSSVNNTMMMASGSLGSGLGSSTPPSARGNAQDGQKVACEALALFENHTVAIVELNVNPLDKNSIVAKLQDKTSDANKGSLTKDETYNGTDIYKIDLGGNAATFYGLLIGKEGVLATNKDTLKSVVDAYKDSSKSLSSNANYTTALTKLPSDRSMTIYMDAGKFAGVMGTAMDEASKDGSAMMGSSLNSMKSMYDQMKNQSGVSVMGVSAQANGLQIDTASAGTSGLSFNSPLMSSRDVVNRIPEGTWGFIASADLKDMVSQAFTYLDKMNYFQSMGMGNMNASQLKQQFTQATGLDLDNDILSWMGGEWGFYLQPTNGDMHNTPNLVFALNVKDSKDKANAAIQKINQALKDKAGATPTQVQVAGSTVYKFGSSSATEEHGDSVYYGIVGDYFYITNRQTAIEAFNTGKGGLASTANYKGAMTNAVSNNNALMYVDIQAIVQGYEKYQNDQVQKNPDDSYYKEQLSSFENNVKPFLAPFHSIGISSDSANGVQHAVIFVDIEK